MNLSEKQVLYHCKQYLNLLQACRKLVFKRISVSAVPHSKKGRDIIWSKNEMVGMADLMVFIPNGPVLHLECKSTTGKLSKEQITWKSTLERIGHTTYYVIRNIEDMIAVLKKHNVDC